jgi:DNA polymerase-3 subunit delta'
VEPEEGKQRLSIELIRGVERFLSLTPVESDYKVALITDFESATLNAANALLKTLEEPPTYGRIIMLATDPDLLLPTIVSRSQQINLRPVASDVIKNALIASWGVEPQKAEQLARMAGGRVGWAVNAATDPQVLDKLENTLTLLFDAMQDDVVARFTIANSLARTSDNLSEVLEIWLTCWRDVMLFHTDNATAMTYKEKQATILQMAEASDLHQTTRTIRLIEEALTALQQNVNKQLLVENLVLSFPVLHLEVD